MLNYIIKRVLNFLVMVVLASTLGYLLSSLAFDPRSNYQGANPPIPESTINSKLDNLGVTQRSHFSVDTPLGSEMLSLATLGSRSASKTLTKKSHGASG